MHDLSERRPSARYPIRTYHAHISPASSTESRSGDAPMAVPTAHHDKILTFLRIGRIRLHEAA